MNAKSQKHLARKLIIGRLRSYAKDQRRTHQWCANSTFYYAAAGEAISFAKCLELITPEQAERFDKRLDKIMHARISRGVIKAAA